LAVKQLGWMSGAKTLWPGDSHWSLARSDASKTGLPIRKWKQPFDLHGLSVFLRDDERVFHTYSAYARGCDNLGFTSNFLDLTPLGRQEERPLPR
jgi:predicted dithiol-disulfide oxidoreductase (DUF899 family)